MGVRMKFSEKIQKFRNEAQETQAANKIIDMLTKLKLSNDNTTAYRWVWELIQNAKDIVNSTGKVDILITMDEINKFVEFSHNGKLFTTENIVFLIEQVSTKDRVTSEMERKTTGKFGTGFLTTHLLSEKVEVSGLLQDTGEDACSFGVVLDRSGKDKTSIIEAIQSSCNQLDKNTSAVLTNVNESEFNTCFKYEINEQSLEIAKKGIKSLLLCVPYVFAFVPQLDSVTVRDGKCEKTITRGSYIPTEMVNAVVSSVNIKTKGKEEKEERYIFTLSKDNVSLAVEVEKNNEANYIKPYNLELPKLFCDFPLLGTDDFAFPVLINCHLFNPTEPRNGIHLTDKNHEHITENKQNITNASNLYIELIEYFSKKNYEGIYNIVIIKDPIEKTWLSSDWINENVTDYFKNKLKYIPVINTLNNKKVSLLDNLDDSLNVFVPNNETEEVRKKVWELSQNLCSDKLVQGNEVECWYHSLWNECHNHSFFDLVEIIEDVRNVDSLSSSIQGDIFEWINNVVELFYSPNYNFFMELGRHPKIIPNQNGQFCSLNEVKVDLDVDESYKEISLIIRIDLKKILIEKKINHSFLPDVPDYKNIDAIYEIQNNLGKWRNTPQIVELYKNILCLSIGGNDKMYNELNDFLSLTSQIDKFDFDKKHKVKQYSPSLMQEALKYWKEKIVKDISIYSKLNDFSDEYFSFKQEAAVIWLDKLINMLVKYEQSELLNRYSILPNQYGCFKKSDELSLDSGEIDDILKNASISAGYDIRNELLLAEIFYQLPENRTKYLDDVSDKITKYVKENKERIMQNDSDEKHVFQQTYLWLRKNKEEENVKKCFKELLLNLHWFYNDTDIAENIAKVEKYDDILSKYGVTDVQQLEKILSRVEVETKKEDNLIISQELLAQWGISSEDELRLALASNVLGAEFLHDSLQNVEMFNYASDILDRAKKNIFDHLETQEYYDVRESIEIHRTISIIKKHNQEIYLITRPSDYGKVILYYGSELDMLDYEKDCELWVEDGKGQPQKITFGKMLKLTGVNKIPLRSIR